MRPVRVAPHYPRFGYAVNIVRSATVRPTARHDAPARGRRGHLPVAGLLRSFPSVGIAYNTKMTAPKVVLDTNVLVAGLRSRLGASFRLLQLLGSAQFEIGISVPLVLEYEDVLMRQTGLVGLDEADVAAMIDYICLVGQRQRIYYLWRPMLRDPKDELVLELAVAANCDGIVTFNVKDFLEAEQFGLSVMTPREFLFKIGEIV
jgi:putative PIN family toxin of toxin-antitoxin system